jgi:hypothetical protein
VAPSEVAIAQSLAGPSAQGIDTRKLVKLLIERNRPQDGKIIYKLTKVELLPLVDTIMKSLSQKGKGGSVNRDQIYSQAMEYIAPVEPLTNVIEQFGLTSTQEGWKPGLEAMVKLAGHLISISGTSQAGLRYIQGAPSLLGWRMLCLCGSMALGDDEFELLKFVLTEPIEVEELSGKFSNRSLLERRILFYPEAFLGHADIPMQYFNELWNREKYLQSFFDSNESYQMAVAKFFIIMALAAKPYDGRPLYPGYRLIPQAGRAMSSLTSRMFSSNVFLESIAAAIGETGSKLKESWAERVKLINSTSSDRWPPIYDEVSFPAEFGER